jgi:hypothetical protein
LNRTVEEKGNPRELLVTRARVIARANGLWFGILSSREFAATAADPTDRTELLLSAARDEGGLRELVRECTWSAVFSRREGAAMLASPDGAKSMMAERINEVLYSKAPLPPEVLGVFADARAVRVRDAAAALREARSSGSPKREDEARMDLDSEIAVLRRGGFLRGDTKPDDVESIVALIAIPD